MSADALSPKDLTWGREVRIRIEGGQFAAYLYADEFARVYEGSGYGSTLDEAVREAIDDAE